MASVKSQPTPYGADITVRRSSSRTLDTKKDYDLSGVEIEPAENGLIVVCRYTLKPKVKMAMRKKDEYCDSYMEPVRHVFDDRAAAGEFLKKEIDRLVADNVEEEQWHGSATPKRLEDEEEE